SEGGGRPSSVGTPAGARKEARAGSRPFAGGFLSRAVHVLLQPNGGRQGHVSQVSSLLALARDHGGVAIRPTVSGLFASARANRARAGMGRITSAEILSQGGPMSQTPVVLLSGRDLQGVLRPATAITALRETYAALSDHRGDQGRSVGFNVEGGSIHVKSGLLPGSHLAFASKVNVNLPENPKLRGLPTIQGMVVVSDAKDG